MGACAALTRPGAEAATGTCGVSPYLPSHQSWGGRPSSLELQHPYQHCATGAWSWRCPRGLLPRDPRRRGRLVLWGSAGSPGNHTLTTQARPVWRGVPLPLCLDPSGVPSVISSVPFCLSGVAVTPLASLFACLLSLGEFISERTLLGGLKTI